MPVPDDDAGLHHAGATVRHQGPFSHLEVPVSQEPPDRALLQTWVAPLYTLNPANPSARAATALRAVWGEIDEAVALRLFSEFDWRPRLVGALLVALKRMPAHEDLVGRLLLRSDVYKAGEGYCLALARLNTPGALDYLTEYLRYYLGRPDLWFEQAEAMAAVGHLDGVNGTERLPAFLPAWEAFVRNKPHWDLGRSRERFERRMEGLEALAVRSGT